MGQMMFVGLIAIIIASIVNIFIGSTVMQMVISALAIIIFLGLTAYDTQRIREAVSVDTSPTVEVTGALTLYMDFINLFLNLLQLFGDRKYCFSLNQLFCMLTVLLVDNMCMICIQ